MHNYYQEMSKIYNKLQDDESKKLFEARISYLLNKNMDEFLEVIDKLYDKDEWYFRELEERLAAIKPKGIVIFGCGHDGKMTNALLTKCGYDVSCYCDNHKFGMEIDGKKVLSVNEIIVKYRDYLVIIGSSQFGKEMYSELVERGFPAENVLLPQFKVIWAERGMQYFDMFKPQADEVYIDAGTFDGKTVLDFVNWTKGNYKKIYAFEPMADMYEVSNKLFREKGLTGIELINGATWNRQEMLHFVENGASSQKSDKGEIAVQGIPIDAVLKKTGEKATFIKMDIEGSELNAIEGAKDTIVNEKPRLALCIYHKPMDIIEIPSRILELVPEYKLFIRHYGSHFGEEVMYATL